MSGAKGIQLVFRCFIILLFSVAIIIFLYMSSITRFLRSEKTINILAWGAILDKEFVKEFEEKTSIQVNISYFENNEELFVKLQSVYNHGYDLIMPTDWAVDLLIKKGLIKKIDRAKITIWNEIYPTLLNHYFDQHNEYSIPFSWSLFGIGANRRYFHNTIPRTWKLVFDPFVMPPHISMPEDARHLMHIAALYLFGSTHKTFSQHDIESIKQLLRVQKPHVDIYTDLRPEYVLVSEETPVVVGLLADLLKIMRVSDNFEFIIPREGVFVMIDSFAIPTATNKDEFIYDFLEYIYDKKVVTSYVEKFQFLPARPVDVHYDERLNYLIQPTSDMFSNAFFFKNDVPKDIYNDILIALKS